MIRNRSLIVIMVLLLVLDACEKEDDDFEYPPTIITEPTTVTHMERTVKSSEVWVFENSANGCQGGLAPINYAYYDTSETRGYVTMHLIPDTTTCDASVFARSAISENEVPSDYWDNWTFEFTFSELRINSETELRVQLHYREVEFDVDVATFMRETIAPDTSFLDTNGVFAFTIREGHSKFSLNGIEWTPDFSAETGNRLVTDATSGDPFFKVTISADGTPHQSVIVFSYLRTTSYGIPEQ